MRLLLIGLAATLCDAQVTFSNQENDAGLFMVFDTNGSLAVEHMTGGAAAGDFNRDGYQDLFCVGGIGTNDCLYINNGDGTFTEAAAAWGVNVRHRGAGVAVGDYDNDGWLDVYVTSQGPVSSRQPGHHKLYRNNGDGTFTDMAAFANVDFTSNSDPDAFSASFGDYDLDGDLDLAVAAWYGTFSNGNRIFRNDGDGTFTDVTVALVGNTLEERRGFAPRFTDMNGDRYPELLWVSDFYSSGYYVNNTDGTFTEMTVPAGVGLDSNGMGTTTGDFDGDLVLDWYVTSRIGPDGIPGHGASGNMLYRQTATPHVYDEVSVASGVNTGWWGWGSAAVDFEHDGDLDIVATNGQGNTYEDPNVLFLNNGDMTFTEDAESAGLATYEVGRGLVTFDVENDGDQDILIVAWDQQLIFYRNELDNDNGWIRLFFDTGAVSDLAPDGFGTRVHFHLSDGTTILRYLDGGTNYLSQSELAVHAGLGQRTIDSIDIMWADGETLTLAQVPANQTLTITARHHCPGDWNTDGSLDIFDMLEYLSDFDAAHPQADINADGSFDIFDVLDYLNAFSTGC